MFRPICSVIFLKQCHRTGLLNNCREPFFRWLCLWKLVLLAMYRDFLHWFKLDQYVRINEVLGKKCLIGLHKEGSLQWIISLVLNLIMWLMTKEKSFFCSKLWQYRWQGTWKNKIFIEKNKDKQYRYESNPNSHKIKIPWIKSTVFLKISKTICNFPCRFFKEKTLKLNYCYITNALLKWTKTKLLFTTTRSNYITKDNFHFGTYKTTVTFSHCRLEDS